MNQFCFTISGLAVRRLGQEPTFCYESTVSHWAGSHSLVHLSSERVKAWTERERYRKWRQNAAAVKLSRPEVIAAGMEAGVLKGKSNPWH